MRTDTADALQGLAARRRQLIESLKSQPRGLSWCEEHTNLIDQAVQTMFSADRIAVIAVGGYGRRELAPFSDIDLTVVPEEDGAPEIDDAIRQLFQDLHEGFNTIFGMEIAYAYRLVADAPGLDAKTRTGLLDSRLVAGSPQVFRALQDALEESFSPGEFIIEKIEERERMFAKFHDTPLVVEPHLKEGAGGLRCFHCSNWIRTAIGEREARPHAGYNSVVQMRNLAHAVAGKQADLLSRQRQAEIAERLGIDPFEMMSAQARNAESVHRRYRRAVEKLCEARFSLSRGCLAVQGEARVLPGSDAGEAAYGISIATRLGLRVSDLPSATGTQVSGAAAAAALCQGEKTIRNIDRSGLLDGLLPELARCRTLMPRDSVHAYTVFEHSLRVVRALREAPAWLAPLHDGLSEPEALYLAALIHDVGKLEDEERHAEIGAELARGIAAKWQLSPSIADDLVWLVANHLETAHILRFRDLAAPETALEFAKVVGIQRRLDMLALLHFADVASVADGIWTSAQGASLRELHEKTSALLASEIVPLDPSTQRKRLMSELGASDASPEEVQAFVSSLPVHYLNSTPFDLVRLHIGMVASARAASATVEVYQRHDLGATDFTVCCLDMPGLLSEILGTFYALDLRVQAIRACTTAGEPVALDVFTVNFGGRAVPSATAAEASRLLKQVATRAASAEKIMQAHGKDPSRTQRVLSYRYIAGLPGILEVRAPRGRGLPFRLARWVAQHGWNIQSARLGQWAENASAALYLTQADGSELPADTVESAMRERAV